MDINKKLQEQEAPLKNTDQAFVKVSEDGSPDLSIEEMGQDTREETHSESEGSGD